MSDESNAIADETESQNESDAMGRTVFNVITMIICCMALIVTWSSKNSDNNEETSTCNDNKQRYAYVNLVHISALNANIK